MLITSDVNSWCSGTTFCTTRTRPGFESRQLPKYDLRKESAKGRKIRTEHSPPDGRNGNPPDDPVVQWYTLLADMHYT